MSARTSRPGGRPARATVLAGGALVAALTATAWYGWLGRDHEYQVDPVTGAVSGPYEAWQVAGCVLSLLALALAAGVLLRPLVPLAVVPPAFTVAWSVDAAAHDESGLWAVGAVMLLFGLVLGAAAVTGVTTPLHDRVTRRRLGTAAG